MSANLALPEFLLALAEERISKRHLTRATLCSELYAPADAVSAHDKAMESLKTLTGYESQVFAISKQRVRGAVAERVLANLREDVARM